VFAWEWRWRSRDDEALLIKREVGEEEEEKALAKAAGGDNRQVGVVVMAWGLQNSREGRQLS
jgi:hypothetical protein